MKLKELISTGLEVGQLVQSTTESTILQYAGKQEIPLSNGIIGDMLYKFIPYAHSEKWELKSFKEVNKRWGMSYPEITTWELTTAYDIGISPEMLPIVEPFSTGWVICPDMIKRKILEFIPGKYWEAELGEEPYKEPDFFQFTDYTNNFIDECRPCLAPK